MKSPLSYGAAQTSLEYHAPTLPIAWSAFSTNLIYKITAEPSSPILAYSDGEDDSDKELEEEKEEGKTDVIYPELNDPLMQVIKKNYFDTVL